MLLSATCRYSRHTRRSEVYLSGICVRFSHFPGAPPGMEGGRHDTTCRRHDTTCRWLATRAGHKVCVPWPEGSVEVSLRHESEPTHQRTPPDVVPGGQARPTNTGAVPATPHGRVNIEAYNTETNITAQHMRADATILNLGLRDPHMQHSSSCAGLLIVSRTCLGER